MKLRMFIVGVLFIAWSSAYGESLHSVVGGLYTPSITGYSEVAQEAFRREDIRFEGLQLPPKRMPVALGSTIDMYVLSKSSMGQGQEYLVSKYPVGLIWFGIYFNKKQRDWQPSWPPNDKFKLMPGVSVVPARSLKNKWGLNMSMIKSFKSAVKMVNVGRAQYWIESIDALNNIDLSLLHLDGGYVVEKLYPELLFYVFRNDTRGIAIKNAFDQGYEQILADGSLLKYYSPNEAMTHSGEDLLEYFKENNYKFSNK